MKPKHLQLEAARCPMAMIYVRKSINLAVAAGYAGDVIITTIEPSMKRDLPLFLTSVENNVNLKSHDITPLSTNLKNAWLESGEATSDELINITDQHSFTLTFN